MTSDELLESFVRESAESAFALLVKRHLNLVYSTALRHVRSPHLAEEVTQSVFIDLARQAARIKTGTPLVAWLHLVARRSAVDAIRKESRRKFNESKAAAMISHAELDVDTVPPWADIEPLLDDALESLKPIDRAAILLRFFEDKSFQDVAKALGLTEDAAQKRVSRALEEVRQFLTKRGVHASAAGLSSSLAMNAMHSAPVALSSAIISSATFNQATFFALTKSVTEIAMTTTQKIVAGTILAAALAGGIYQIKANGDLREELRLLRNRAESDARDLQLLRDQRAASAKALEDMSKALAAERSKTASFASNDSQAEAALDAWLQKVVNLKKYLEQNSRYQIPEFSLLREKDWLDATKDIELADEWDYRSALATLRTLAKQQFLPKVSDAFSKYLKASNGVPPSDVSALAQFMEKPVEPAIWQRYRIVANNPNTNDGFGFTSRNGKTSEWLLTEKTLVDDYFDTSFYASDNGVAFSGLPKFDKEFRQALNAFRAVHPNERATSAGQLAPYLQADIDPGFVQRKLNKTR